MEFNLRMAEELPKRCRICLGDEKLCTPMFGEISAAKSVIDKINMCVPFKITKDEEYDDKCPQNICFKCLADLECSYDFITMAVRANAHIMYLRKRPKELWQPPFFSTTRNTNRRTLMPLAKLSVDVESDDEEEFNKKMESISKITSGTRRWNWPDGGESTQMDDSPDFLGPQAQSQDGSRDKSPAKDCSGLSSFSRLASNPVTDPEWLAKVTTRKPDTAPGTVIRSTNWKEAMYKIKEWRLKAMSPTGEAPSAALELLQQELDWKPEGQ